MWWWLVPWVGDIMVAILDRMIGEYFSKELALEQKPEWWMEKWEFQPKKILDVEMSVVCSGKKKKSQYG